MEDWKALTIGVYGTLAPKRTQVLRLWESPQLGLSERALIQELFADLQRKQAAVEAAKAWYEGSEIRTHVLAPEEATFLALKQDLFEHTGQIRTQDPARAIADVRKYRDYLQDFLAAGPHGPGKPPPEEGEGGGGTSQSGPGPHGPGPVEPGKGEP